MTTEPATIVLDDYDPDRPTYEIWVDGVRFASTQRPGDAHFMFGTMHASRRYGDRGLELRVVNDRRATTR